MAHTSLTTAHMHIGPGRLGLGLVVASGLEAGLDVHLVAREASELPDEPHFRTRERCESHEKVEPLQIATFSKADTIDSLCEEAKRLALESTELLITVAATTKGLEERQSFLLEVARARAASAVAMATSFIPCENDPGPFYAGLKAKLEDLGVECRDAMVNRLCPELCIDETDGSYEVIVDEMAEWVIEGRPDQRSALAALESLSHVSFTPDIQPFETRKRWLVNGAHLALAILAHAREIPTINAAAAEPRRREWLEKLHEALIESLEQRHPGMEDNGEYAKRHVASWARNKDDVVRVLRRLRRADPLPFFDDLERKLIEPISMLDDVSSFPQVRYVLDRLDWVLRRATSYVDYESLKTFLPTLSLAVDDRTCARYEGLLAPIIGAEEARQRAENLAVALASHRGSPGKSGTQATTN